MEEETRMRATAKIRNIAFIRKVLFGMWMSFHGAWSSIGGAKNIKRGGKKPEAITGNALGDIPPIARLSPRRVCRSGDSLLINAAVCSDRGLRSAENAYGSMRSVPAQIHCNQPPL